MPQEIALYEDLTIEEMLNYFGRIFQMSGEQVRRRSVELGALLQLPEAGRYVRTLSGGQQRRVSFAATIIHRPPLIILDEPTAGVDPLLREKIWRHLGELSRQQNCTILVTTHYIEEARRAAKIGFMRKGRILCEGNPRDLLDQHRVATLEEVFLRICVRKRKSTIATPDELLHFKHAYQLEKQLNRLRLRPADRRDSGQCEHRSGRCAADCVGRQCW